MVLIRTKEDIDSKYNNKAMHSTSENKTAKEVKVVVNEPPATTSKSESSMGKKDDQKTSTVKANDVEPKGLPHQQVPQPGDFSTEAPERL